MNILLVYLPFCTPASPPYSLTYLASFLKANSKHNIDVLDLNLEFHKKKFPEHHKYYQEGKFDDYEEKTTEFNKITSKLYLKNNRAVVNDEKPELFEEMLEKIQDKKPDLVLFSLVYSSQAFYAYALLKELDNVVIGGPAVNDKLRKLAKCLNNEVELLNYIGEDGKQDASVKHDELDCDIVPDFSIYNLKDYFCPKPVIPIKTSSTCYYKGCTFCTHFTSQPYCEYNLELIKQTIKKSKQKHFFLIDDMIHEKRLLELAKMIKPLKVNYTCQLKPKDISKETLIKLKQSGLSMVIWGVESGNNRVLKLMNKGTDKEEIEKVLKDSYEVGIKNVVYIMFGFPGETKEEFLETIQFLKDNDKYIDLVSVSIFGLQKDSQVYKNPEKFKITKIIEEQRTVLEPKLTYEVSEGLSNKEAIKLRNNYKKTIEKINKYPRKMNFFREHMLCSIKKPSFHWYECKDKH